MRGVLSFTFMFGISFSLLQFCKLSMADWRYWVVLILAVLYGATEWHRGRFA